MTERLHFHFSLWCIVEGNDIPLQCSCLENPREGEAWWVAVYGVAQSQTWLKWLSSNSSRVNSVLNRLFKFSCRPYDVAAIIDIMQHKLKESGIRFNHWRVLWKDAHIILLSQPKADKHNRMSNTLHQNEYIVRVWVCMRALRILHFPP